MASADPWPIISAERQALLSDLKSFTEEQWSSPSMCSGWSVRQVVGHMIATARMTPPQFFIGLLKAGFSFEKLAAAKIVLETAGSSADVVTRFSDIVNSRKHPPGPTVSWLGETIVHAEDVRRPLGIGHRYPTDAITRVADFYKGSNLIIGAKKRVAGLTLRATDTDWSTGTGPEVAGPVLSLVLAMTGRSAPIDDLTGEGVATLRTRP